MRAANHSAKLLGIRENIECSYRPSFDLVITRWKCRQIEDTCDVHCEFFSKGILEMAR